jgi:PAS domain S-box-containing protein
VEQSLKYARDRLEETNLAAHLGNWEWDSVNDEITGCEQFYRLFDVAPEGLTRFSQFVERLHPDDRERVQRDVADALKQDRPYDTDYRVKLSNGGWRDVIARGRVFAAPDGKPLRMVGTCLDITNRKRAELELRESERRYRTLAESLPHLVWTCRGDGPCDYLSPRWVDYTGIPEADQLGYRWLEQLHPDDRERVVAEWTKVTPRGDAFDIEFRIRRTDGVYRWFKTRAIPFRDDGGRVIKWFGSNSDIEDYKQAHDSLARSNKELEQFAYVASHDLQEPLRMVASYTQLLAQRYEGQLDDTAKKYIDYAVDGAVRMQQLIQDLLTYSRLNSQAKPPELIDVNNVLLDVFRNLQVAIDESRASVATGELPTVRADASQLQQVFQNLIANGIKFHRDEPPQVHVSAKDLGQQWRFSVQDNGIGIEAQYADRVFGIFQRLHTRQEYPGTGIGLTVCKRIVVRHGGKIWFESELGKGTTFFFTLPK